MAETTEIHPGRQADIAALEALYVDAFPDEDLSAVLDELLRDRPDVLSLVAADGSEPVGHIAFTACTVGDTDEDVWLLGPLAVAPVRQRHGIGSALVAAGLDRGRTAGVAKVLVLGDPAYYGRLGFIVEDNVDPPYPLPEEWRGAWQSIALRPIDPPLTGMLCVSDPWRQPALWGP